MQIKINHPFEKRNIPVISLYVTNVNKNYKYYNIIYNIS